MSALTGHTPAPWRWEFNRKSRQVSLVGGRPCYDLTILEPVRWGMSGAGLMLRNLDAPGNLMHKLHQRPDWCRPFKDRNHHADWCAGVVHADMTLMAAAPELLAELKAAMEYIPATLQGPARAAIAKAEGGRRE